MRFVTIKKATVLVTLALGAALVLAACATSTKARFDASNVACSQVSTQLVQAQSDLASAKSKLQKDDGPGRQNDQKAVDRAQAKVDALTARQASPECTVVPSSPAASTQSPAANNGTTTVVDSNGNRVQLPFVSGESVNNGDTRNSRTMPSLSKLLPDCGVLADWAALVKCVRVHHATWYVDGVNRFSSLTGFTWSDVLKWAKAKTPKGENPEVRVIFLTGSKRSLSDAQARAAVSGLVGNRVARTLQVVRFDASAFMNTWRTDGSSPAMTDFVDFNNEVRVSLVPEVLNRKGQVVGLDRELRFSGVFVDCYNVHGRFPVVPPTPHAPLPTPTPCVTPPPPEGGNGKGFRFNPVTCTWVKVSCLNRNGQACGPNLPFQPPQSPGNGVQSSATNPVPGVSSEPSPNPTQPVNLTSPAPANSSGYNGGGTSNPVVSGTPTPVDTGSYSSPVPTPSW